MSKTHLTLCWTIIQVMLFFLVYSLTIPTLLEWGVVGVFVSIFFGLSEFVFGIAYLVYINILWTPFLYFVSIFINGLIMGFFSNSLVEKSLNLIGFDGWAGLVCTGVFIGLLMFFRSAWAWYMLETFERNLIVNGIAQKFMFLRPNPKQEVN